MLQSAKSYELKCGEALRPGEVERKASFVGREIWRLGGWL